MPFLIFKNKKELYRASELEIKNMYGQLEEKIKDGPITCLHGKGKELSKAVFIYSQSFLNAFDKNGVKYRLLSEDEALQNLSKQGKEHLERLKCIHPEFIV